MGRRKVEKLQKPCQICSKSAVGFHYGAYVCEACKKFFVRHSSGVCRSYGSCQENGNCNLNIEGRGKCQHCRFKRCLEVGMNTNFKSSDYNLTSIPCQVCGSKSSGLHFGCITCEGCKGFFRRMIKFKGLLVCFNNNQCSLDFTSRNMCKSCRLDRCLKIGMSRKGIRIGRHPNFLKHRCLKEVEQQFNKDAESLAEYNSTDSNTAINTKIEDSDEEVSDQEDSPMLTPVSPNTQTNTNTNTPQSESISSSCQIQLSSEQVTSNNTIRHFPLTTIKNEPGLSNKPIYSHFDCNIDDLNVLENIEDIESVLSAACAFLDRKFTNINDLEDVLPSKNGSIHSIWAVMMDHFVYHSQFIVNFAKLIPGFSKLSLSDKKMVIKVSLYPMILIELGQDYQETTEDVFFNYFDFSVVDRKLILQYFPEFVVFSNHVRFSGNLIFRLGLNSIGLVLLCGIMMFCNCDKLENSLLGKSMNLLYQQCLKSYLQLGMHLNPKETKIKMEKCMELVNILNTMNNDHHRIIEEFCVSHAELQYPDLYIEIFKH